MSTLLEDILSLPPEKQDEIIQSLSSEQAHKLLYDWEFWARPEQRPPNTNWRIWAYIAGRGAGKTRAGAEWVLTKAQNPKARIALVAPTAADTRDVMIEGESGIMSVGDPELRPKYEPSKRRLKWKNGAKAYTYSAEEPERLRGPQHTDAWCDELGAWKKDYAAWDMLMFGLRLPPNPQCIVTTTPKPVKIIRNLFERFRNKDGVEISVGSTYSNRLNLSPQFFSEIISKYEGTRLGRQEINAELLEDVPGALWTLLVIEELRVDFDKIPDLVRIVVAVDPAVSAGEKSDETGIVVVGKGVDGHGYVLQDSSCRLSPDGWANRVKEAYDFWGADRVIGEVNNGGDLVERNIRITDKNISYKAVRASRGKTRRAEPVSALYEKGKVHHVVYRKGFENKQFENVHLSNNFDLLEDQMCMMTSDEYCGDGSPDRVDALVWALTELMVDFVDMSVSSKKMFG